MKEKLTVRDMIAVVLAGGKGTRLESLTADCAKPAVEFGGKWRLVDFVLGNVFNSDVEEALVLTQFKSQKLTDHINDLWGFDQKWRRGARPVPAQQNISDCWYNGTADAVFQNLSEIKESRKKRVCILGADHVYKLDMRVLNEWHETCKSKFTICLYVVPTSEASEFGVVVVDETFRIIGFVEKPKNPEAYEIPGRPGFVFVSMGIYVVDTDFLCQILQKDAVNENSKHDFGKDIIPLLVSEGKVPVFGFDFSSDLIEGEVEPYWRDVGSVDALLESQMDTTDALPHINLYNKDWQIRTYNDGLPGAKTVGAPVLDFCTLSGGDIITRGCHEHVVFGRNVCVTDSKIRRSVIGSGTIIERGCEIQNAIIGENSILPPYTRIGFSQEEDAARFFVSEKGNVLVPNKYNNPTL
jgi:glucose-1-phosphate adenylyltransferase